MYAPERQQAMAARITRAGRASVLDLAALFGVTGETVRRDLDALEKSGVVRRVHGGAVPAAALAMPETDVAKRDLAHSEAKDNIASAALAYLPADGTVLFDAGTTTTRMAGLIPQNWRLTAFTHALPVAFRLATNRQVQLHILGGRVRGVTQATVGANTAAALADLRVDVAFVGTNGLALDHGLSTPDADEAAVKAALVKAAREVVVLADASKLGAIHPFRFATLDQVDVLVTDSAADPRHVEQLRNDGIKVTLA